MKRGDTMEKTLFFENNITDRVIYEVREAMKENDVVNVSFSVIGRTCHQMLSCQLAEILKDEFNFEIGYNYKCRVTKKR